MLNPDPEQNALPCRIVRHDLPDGDSHLDIFIEHPSLLESELLLTYEISGTAQNILLQAIRSNPDSAVVLQEWDEKKLINYTEKFPIIEARRKKNHRLLYREYEGPLSGNRGNIVEIARSQFFGLQERIPADFPGTLPVVPRFAA